MGQTRPGRKPKRIAVPKQRDRQVIDGDGKVSLEELHKNVEDDLARMIMEGLS